MPFTTCKQSVNNNNNNNCLGEMIIVKTMFSFLIFLDLMAVIHLLSVEWQEQSEVHEQNTDLNRFAMCL